MAMLEKAKKASEEKDTKKKHHHKKPESEQAAQPAPEDTGGEDESDQEAPSPQPDSGAEDSGEDGPSSAGQPPQQPQDQGGDSDQGGADADSDQPDQQQPGGQGAQGAAPVPNPAAPGAGDTTSGGADTPPQGEGDTGGDETPGEDTEAGGGSEASLPQIPMSPGLKEEYEEANKLLEQLLYQDQNDKLATAVTEGLMPSGPGKIKNAAMLAVHIVVQMHHRIKLPSQIVLPFCKDVVSHIIDLAEQVKQIQYSDQEATAILGTVYEAALRIWGVSQKQTQTMQHLLGKQQMQKQAQKYQQAHAFAKPAIDANKNDFHNPKLAGQGGPAAPSGPQTGAPAGAQQNTPQPPAAGAPQPGQGGPPAGGGMLNQAAAQGAQ